MKVLQAIFNFFYEIIFGCHHEHVTRPFTLNRETYKVCLDCGRQIFYSPAEMRPLSTRELRRMRAVHVGELKVIGVTAGAPQLVPSREHNSSLAA